MTAADREEKHEEPSRRRPNIVFVLTDDHAAHAVGAYGSAVNQTPRIDEIAENGWRLDRMYCTNSLCAPSRASILTGTHSHLNGVTTLATHFDNQQPTFPSLLREAGYRTALVGKWHLGEGAAHQPTGFDYWEVLRDQGEYFDPLFIGPDGESRESGYATDVITDKALAWLDTLEEDEPFCLLVHHKAPHRAWEPDAKHAEMYADPIPVPDTFDDDYATRGLAAHRARMRVADDLTEEDLKRSPPEELDHRGRARWKQQRWMEDYLACIASVDDNVGRLADRLRERGQFDRTVLIYSSDQGFFLGDHGWFDKRFMYEESIRMPFVLSYPAEVSAGGSSDQIVTNVDIAQTLLDFAGVDAHPRMQGRSFRPLLTGEAEPVPREQQEFYYRYYENDDPNHAALAHYGIRTDRYKLIYYYADGMGHRGASPRTYPQDWELFDLQRDPAEMHNRYLDPAYAKVRRELTERLERLQREVGDEPHPSQRPVSAHRSTNLAFDRP